MAETSAGLLRVGFTNRYVEEKEVRKLKRGIARRLRSMHKKGIHRLPIREPVQSDSGVTQRIINYMGEKLPPILEVASRPWLCAH